MSKLKHVYFIVSANTSIGYGHLKRCQLIADEFSLNQINCTFLLYNTPDKAKNNICSKHEIKCYNDAENLLEKLSVSIHNVSQSLLIIDSDYDLFYNLNTQNQILDFGIKFMFITIKNVYLKSHYLFNQNIMALDEQYNLASYTKKILGPEYFILDDSLKEIKPNCKSKTEQQHLLITFGGSDPGNVTERILSLINIQQFKKIDVVIGGLVPNKGLIINHPFVKKYPEIFKIHVDTKDMYEIMKNTDIAITAMGLTFWELILHNIPCLVIAGSKREKSQINYFCKNKYAWYLGDYDDANWEEKWKTNYNHFFEKKIVLKDLSNKVNIDGKKLLVKKLLSDF